MDGINKMTTQGKKFVELAYQLPEEDLHDLILYLKTRQVMQKACGDRATYKPLSLEKWCRLPIADRHMIFHMVTQTTNQNLVRLLDGWFSLKPWQKAYLFVKAMYYYYKEIVRKCFRHSIKTTINK